MKTVTEHLRESLLQRAGVHEDPISDVDLDSLRRTEWSPDFERLMRNRLVMGAFRYGLMGDPKKPKWDRVPDMQRRLRRYLEDGNDEHLVDVANLCMMEFVEGTHPNKHFKAQDDTEHVTKK